MEIEEQVCSFGLARRLKELGVKQESLWWWTLDMDVWKLLDNDQFNFIAKQVSEKKGRKMPDHARAFTVAELGEMMPSWIESHKSPTDRDAGNILPGWSTENTLMVQGEPKYQHANTEANARAKMLIYLLENELIRP
jgi:hypothetical protein